MIGVFAQDLRPPLFPEVSVVGRLGHDSADNGSSGRAGGDTTPSVQPPTCAASGRPAHSLAPGAPPDRPRVERRRQDGLSRFDRPTDRIARGDKRRLSAPLLFPQRLSIRAGGRSCPLDSSFGSAEAQSGSPAGRLPLRRQRMCRPARSPGRRAMLGGRARRARQTGERIAPRTKNASSAICKGVG